MPRKKVYENDDPKQRRLGAVNAYKEKNNLKRVAIDMPEEKIAEIKTFAADHGMSMVGLFTAAVDYYMGNYGRLENDNSKKVSTLSSDSQHVVLIRNTEKRMHPFEYAIKKEEERRAAVCPKVE